MLLILKLLIDPVKVPIELKEDLFFDKKTTWLSILVQPEYMDQLRVIDLSQVSIALFKNAGVCGEEIREERLQLSSVAMTTGHLFAGLVETVKKVSLV